MKCSSCFAEIQPALKHAISRNECPFCGQFIFGEEMMAAVEDVKKTILAEVAVREENALKLAFAIVTKYNIGGVESFIKPIITEKPEGNIKIAPASGYKQVEVASPQILEASKLIENGKLNAIDCEKILEQAVKEKYNMVDQTMLDTTVNEGEDALSAKEIDEMFAGAVTGKSNKGAVPNQALDNMFGSADQNSVLEAERLLRLSKQQKMLSKSGGFGRK